MKLLKKLLPVAAIASTAAIVAPIVTSCGAGVTYKEYDKDGNFIEYKSVVDQHAAVTEAMSNDKALTEYLKAANENKKLIPDDYFVFRSQQDKPKYEAEPKVTRQIDYQFNVTSVDVEKKTVSATMKMNRKVVTEETDEKIKETSKTTETINAAMVVKNIPVAIEWTSQTSEGNIWNFGFWYTQISELTTNKTWSVDFKLDYKKIIETSMGTEEQKRNENFKATSESNEVILSEVMTYLRMYLYIPGSHFLQKVQGTL